VKYEPHKAVVSIYCLRHCFKVCATQQPTAKTRQFESNSMRATVSKNMVNGH